MPIYRYNCTACQRSVKMVVVTDPDGPKQCKTCQGSLQRAASVPDGIAMETTDDYRGQSRFADTESKRQSRASDHFRKVELKRRIEREGTESAKKNGWLKDEDTPK